MQATRTFPMFVHRPGPPAVRAHIHHGKRAGSSTSHTTFGTCPEEESPSTRLDQKRSEWLPPLSILTVFSAGPQTATTAHEIQYSISAQFKYNVVRENSWIFVIPSHRIRQRNMVVAPDNATLAYKSCNEYLNNAVS